MPIERSRFTSTLNVNVYYVTEFPPLLSFTVYYFHSKISSYASFIHKNCSGQLLSAYFLFSRLPFAVNVNLLFLEFFNARHDVHSAGWRSYVTGIPSIFSSKIMVSRSAFESQPSAVIARVLNKNAVS